MEGNQQMPKGIGLKAKLVANIYYAKDIAFEWIPINNYLIAIWMLAASYMITIIAFLPKKNRYEKSIPKRTLAYESSQIGLQMKIANLGQV